MGLRISRIRETPLLPSDAVTPINSRNDQNPIAYIEDTTRKAHNGCRLPRKRRVM